MSDKQSPSVEDLAAQVAQVTEALGVIAQAVAAQQQATPPSDRSTETEQRAAQASPAPTVVLRDQHGKPFGLATRSPKYRHQVEFYPTDADGAVRLRGEKSQRAGEPVKPQRVPVGMLRALIESDGVAELLDWEPTA